jgi:secondary thiamine-phosphate synthase enzyme
VVITERISLGTHGRTDIIDITEKVADKVRNSKIESGIVTIFVPGSTAGITTIEFESGLISDFQAFWSRIAPESLHYAHNARWGDENGYAHVRSSLLGGSLVVPFTGWKLLLGTWQQIVFVDFDNRARQREIVLQIIGE